jgi:VWFA-related protein
VFALFALALTAMAQDAQPITTLKLNSKLVLVPAQIQTKSGEFIYALKPEQFTLEDNGVPQAIKLDDDVDALGLSLAVVVQCSRKAYLQFDRMHGLPALIDELTGGANDEVAFISYGTEIERLTGFTRDEKKIDQAYQDLQPCDDEKDARTLDAVEDAVRLLAKAPVTNRHAILLISETRDHGSKLPTAQVVADLNRNNVVVDAVSFNPGKEEALTTLKYLLSGNAPAPNPKEFLQLLVNAVRRNIPNALANASAGEFHSFNSQKKFEKRVGALSNKVHNYYLISFQQSPTAEPGLHRLKLKVPDYPDAKIRSREVYYAGDDPVPAVTETDLPDDKLDDKPDDTKPATPKPVPPPK